MPEPSRILSRSSAYLKRSGLWVPGLDDEDLVGEFVLAGLLAVRARGRWSWGLFLSAGKREVYDAIRSARRVKRECPGELVSLDATYAEPVSCDREFERLEARVIVGQIMERSRLTGLQRETIESFLRGDRGSLWGSGAKMPEDRRVSNAAYKAIRRMREAAGVQTLSRSADD